MNELPFVNTANKFKDVLLELRLCRRTNRTKTKRQYNLTKSERRVIHEKTDGKCHVCGQEVSLGKFEADHVKAHATGGQSYLDNFLAACKSCNNYRWDYRPDEIKWILKLGVWTRKEIESNSKLGQEMAKMFIDYEFKREKRRKNPRLNS